MTEHQADYNAGAIEHCAHYWQKGESDKWICAFIARRVVGRRDGQTMKLAERLAVSEDTIYNLARAAETYSVLKCQLRDIDRKDTFRVISEYKRKLTYSHFAELGRWITRLDLEPLDAFAILQWAADGNMSVEAMREQIRDEHCAAPLMDWHKKVKRVVNALLSLATDSDMPESVCKWAAQAAARFEKLDGAAVTVRETA